MTMTLINSVQQSLDYISKHLYIVVE